MDPATWDGDEVDRYLRLGMDTSDVDGVAGGVLPWADLFGPAIHVAEQGFPVGAVRRDASSSRSCVPPGARPPSRTWPGTNRSGPSR